MSNSSDNLFADALKNKTAAAPAPAVTASAPVPAAVAAPAAPVEPEADAAPQVTELDMLKNRARLMGINFSNNIGLDSLKAKVQAKLDGEAEVDSEVQETAPVAEQTSTVPVKTKAQAAQELRQEMYKEQMRLIRVRITNLNPAKKDLPGEIFTVANRVLGAVKKFIPYGEATENGYHIPYFIYTQLKEREFLNIKTRKDSKGRQIVETGMAREFALEVLEPLTEKELARLAASQAAAAGMD